MSTHCPKHGVPITSTMTERHFCAVCQHAALAWLAGATSTVRQIFDDGTVATAFSGMNNPEVAEAQNATLTAFANLGKALDDIQEALDA